MPIVSALGMLAGYPGLATEMSARAALFRHVQIVDLQARTPFLLQAWLTPFTPTMGNALGMPAFAYALNPKLPPEALYAADIGKELKKEQRHRLFKAEIEHLMSKLRETPARFPRLSGEVRLPFDPRSTLYNTDGQMFSDVGVPVVLFMENYDISRPGYHDSNDTLANINLDYGAALAAIAIETAARVAQSRG